MKPSQFFSLESAIHQTNSIQNEFEHKTSYVFLKFIDFIKFQNNFKFTSTFALKRFQTEIKTKSMFVSIRHLTPETRWMGSTGGGTFFYTFSKKFSNRGQNLSKNGVPEPPYTRS